MTDTLEQVAGGNLVEATADLVKDLHKPQQLTVGGDVSGSPKAEVLILPRGGGGFEVVPTRRFLDAERERPEFRKGVARVNDLSSFIGLVDRFKTSESALFAINKDQTRELQAVIDYHDRVNIIDQDKAEIAEARPNFMQHRVSYRFPWSKEWLAWLAIIGKMPLDMIDFAEFLEDRILDVMHPPAFLVGGDAQNPPTATSDLELVEAVKRINGRVCGPQKLMELARGLKVHETDKLEMSHSLASGEASLKFSAEHQDGSGAPLKVPSCFLVAIPVFENGPAYRLLVRLRYRKKGPGVVWSLILHQWGKAADHAFKDFCESARAETALPLFYGAPED